MGKGYTSATGELFANEGEFTVPCRTQEGHRRDITFQQSSKVEIPILSTGGLADLDNDVLYSKHDGYIEHLPSGERSTLFKLHGMYFIKMIVPAKYLQPPDSGHSPPERFGRPGAP